MSIQKIHTTNYFDTFIEVAADTKVSCGTKPLSKLDKRTIATMQYELLAKHPYQFTSDDLLFQVYADRNDLIQEDYKQAREQFFSKGQPCFRSSPLTKTYGFGIHADKHGKVALVGMETEHYENFVNNPNIKKVKAMRNSKT